MSESDGVTVNIGESGGNVVVVQILEQWGIVMAGQERNIRKELVVGLKLEFS